MHKFIKIGLIAVILYLLYRAYIDNMQGLIDRPNEAEKLRISQEIIGAHEEFKNGELNNVRKKLPWIDNVMYEDIRALHRKNRFDVPNIMKTLE